MVTECNLTLARSLNLLASFSLHCMHLMKSQTWLHSTPHLVHTSNEWSLRKARHMLMWLILPSWLRISSEYLMLPSSHAVFLWSIHSFLYLLFSFQTYNTTSFILSLNQWPWKIKADRKQFHKPLLPYLRVYSINTHFLCLSLDYFLSYSLISPFLPNHSL